jgi:hypothetical protein
MVIEDILNDTKPSTKEYKVLSETLKVKKLNNISAFPTYGWSLMIFETKNESIKH